MKALGIIIGILLILAGITLAIWLSIYVMLYGGIMAAIDNYEVDQSAFVWAIIRGALFEFGIIPGYILGCIGYLCCGGEIDFD